MQPISEKAHLAASLPQGLLHDRYVLETLIGKGANAVVYKAQDTRSASNSSTTVALKKMMSVADGRRLQAQPSTGVAGTVAARPLHGVPGEAENDVLRWRREADLLRSLDHRNIVKFLDDFVDDEGHMYIVMEYASQGSLLSLIKRAPLPEATAAKYVYEMLCGLAFLHQRGVVHRDIKAANVLLSNDGVAKLSDFGLASTKVATGEKNDHLMMLVGSVYWMSPESILEGRQSDASDVWSVGCTAAELVSGVPPFFDRAPVNALYHIAESTESPISMTLTATASESLVDFLKLCLRRDPRQRPRALALLQHRWFDDVRSLADAAVDPNNNPNPMDHHNAGVPLDTSQPGSSASSPLAASQHQHQQSNTGSGIGTSSQLASTFAIASEVDAFLFGDPSTLTASQRLEWMSGGGLRRCIETLPQVTAEESYRVMRSIAFAAKSLASSVQLSSEEQRFLFTALGESLLWELDLEVLATMDSVSSIFCDCCAVQPTSVTHYAPSQPSALRLVLRSPEAVSACVDALHRLLLVPSQIQTADRDRPAAGSRVGGDTVVVTAAGNFRRSAGPTVPVAAESTVVPPPVNSTVERAAARRRVVADGALVVLQGLLQDVCLQAFREKTEPLMRWENVNRLFELFYSLSTEPSLADDVTPRHGRHHSPLPSMGENWLIAVQEACTHRCPHAVKLLVASVGEVAHRNGGSIVSGERVIVGRLIAVASDPATDAESRLQIAKVLPVLQRCYPEAANALRDRNGNIPLLTHLMRQTPADTDQDALLPVLVELCELSQMATACASYEGMLALMLQKLSEARRRRTLTDLELALKWAEQLFAAAPQPEWFVTSRELTKFLVEVVASRKAFVPSTPGSDRSVTQGTSDVSDVPSRVVHRATRLLNALAAQSVTV